MRLLNYFKIARFLIGPVVFFLLLVTPIDIDYKQKVFLSIFSGVVSFWLLTDIPLFVTGIMGVSLSVITGVSNITEAFAPFANPIIFLFMGGFLLAKALEKTGLDQTLANIALGIPWARGNPKRTIFVFLSLAFVLSMWISNTAAVAMLLPIAFGLIKKIENEYDLHDSGFKESILIALAYSATIGGNATPIGSPPNVIAMGFLESLTPKSISFLEWVLMALPISLILFAVVFYLTVKGLPTFNQNKSNEIPLKEVPNYRTFDIAQKCVLFIFFTTVFAWISPSIIALFVSNNSSLHSFLINNLNASVVGVFLASLLFILPLGREEKVLDSAQINAIDWPSLLLFGSGLSLGGILFKTGLATTFANYISASTGGINIVIVFIFLILVTIFFTELASNTAAANIIIPIMIALATASNINPTVVAVIFALSCNSAFMLPVATPPNAIVYGTNLIKKSTLAKEGFLINIVAWLILSFILLLFHWV